MPSQATSSTASRSRRYARTCSRRSSRVCPAVRRSRSFYEQCAFAFVETDCAGVRRGALSRGVSHPCARGARQAAGLSRQRGHHATAAAGHRGHRTLFFFCFCFLFLWCVFVVFVCVCCFCGCVCVG